MHVTPKGKVHMLTNMEACNFQCSPPCLKPRYIHTPPLRKTLVSCVSYDYVLLAPVKKSRKCLNVFSQHQSKEFTECRTSQSFNMLCVLRTFRKKVFIYGWPEHGTVGLLCVHGRTLIGYSLRNTDSQKNIN